MLQPRIGRDALHQRVDARADKDGKGGDQHGGGEQAGGHRPRTVDQRCATGNGLIRHHNFETVCVALGAGMVWSAKEVAVTQ